jgi:superfamily II RNA helicase
MSQMNKMNKINILDFPFKEEEKELTEIFESYPFQLDNFQKHSIDRIRKEESVLVTAHTGSGKTIMADYAIKLAKQKNKRVIYTSPIKSLSNQKFYEFSQKYKGIMTIGILTGDIKFNPDAECLIMTTEILRNLLYKQKTSNEVAEKHLEINIDMKDVDSVIFDEIHYINDLDRGKVWEESIILLPNHIKLVMLSATIDRAHEFAQWIYNIKGKMVNLISNNKRPIPLTHSVYYFTKFPKKFKKTVHLFDNDRYIKAVSNISKKRMVKVYNSDGNFDNASYNDICNLVTYERKNKRYYSEVEVLNSMITFLQKTNKLPALFFIFSRKKCEHYAGKITTSLNDSKEQNEVNKIINKQLRLLGQPEIYLNDPKLFELKKMLEKGIAVHHSGLLPVYKEIIEILYSKGLIKVLFATETFAVGVNMPTKTVIFTSLEKFTQQGKRMLHTHEYQQMAGRAGRRGLDTHGHVIILANMFRNLPSCHEMNSIMAGKSQYIESKFNFNYQFLLKAMLAEDVNLDEFINKTLLKQDIKQEYEMKLERLHFLENELLDVGFTIEQKIFDEYYYLSQSLEKKNKRAKNIEKIPHFNKQYQLYLDTYEMYQERNYLRDYVPKLLEFMKKDESKSLKYLVDNGYIKNKELTMKGLVASQINECNEIIFTEMLMNDIFKDLSDIEIAGLLGIFCDTKFQEEDKRGNIDNLEIPEKLKAKLYKIQTIINTYQTKENEAEIKVRNEWDMNLDMVEYVYYWASGTSFSNLQFMNFEGNFIRDMIRVDNIAKDLVMMSELVGKLDVMSEANKINDKIIRDLVTIDSLYVRI